MEQIISFPEEADKRMALMSGDIERIKLNKNHLQDIAYKLIFNEKSPARIDANVDLLENVGERSSGEYFGEKAIDEEAPRAATICVESEKCIVATLTRDDYKKTVGDAITQHKEKEADLLSSFFIFKGFSKRKLLSLYYFFEEKNLLRG